MILYRSSPRIFQDLGRAESRLLHGQSMTTPIALKHLSQSFSSKMSSSWGTLSEGGLRLSWPLGSVMLRSALTRSASRSMLLGSLTSSSAPRRVSGVTSSSGGDSGSSSQSLGTPFFLFQGFLF